jgi:hypothetical protein
MLVLGYMDGLPSPVEFRIITYRSKRYPHKMVVFSTLANTITIHKNISLINSHARSNHPRRLWCCDYCLGGSTTQNNNYISENQYHNPYNNNYPNSSPCQKSAEATMRISWLLVNISFTMFLPLTSVTCTFIKTFRHRVNDIVIDDK